MTRCLSWQVSPCAQDADADEGEGTLTQLRLWCPALSDCVGLAIERWVGQTRGVRVELPGPGSHAAAAAAGDANGDDVGGCGCGLE